MVQAGVAAAPETESTTSADGLLTIVLSSANASDAAGVNNTYTQQQCNRDRHDEVTARPAAGGAARVAAPARPDHAGRASAATGGKP
jgi:hypothetical protein